MEDQTLLEACMEARIKIRQDLVEALAVIETYKELMAKQLEQIAKLEETLIQKERIIEDYRNTLYI